MPSPSRLVAAPLLAALLLGPARAHAQPRVVERHGWLTYAGLGVLVGSGTGLSASYLLEREDRGFDRHPILYGTGVGAAAGLALGLTLGIVDRATEGEDGFGSLLGIAALGAFCAVVGGATNFSRDLVGSLSIEGDEESLHADAFPVGAAWGTLVGVGVALVAAPIVLSLPADGGPRRLSLAVGVASRSRGGVWMPTLLGRY